MTHAMTANAKQNDDAALRWIGDLDHPFYEDERNRYVWYEAQAIGFQFMGLATYALAAVSLIIGGADALPYAAAMLAPFVLAAFMLKGYVTRRGADYWPQSMDFRRSRGLVVVAIVALLAIGFVRAFAETSGGSSAISGMAVGAVAAVAALAAGGYRKRKQDAAAELLGDE